MTPKWSIAFVVIANVAALAHAQDSGHSATDAKRLVPAQIPHADGWAKIDGVLDDSIWSQAVVVELAFETSPRENLRAEVETKVYLVENGSELLVAFDARDPAPAAIRAYLRDRDTAWSDDFVGIVIDTFNDHRRAFEFFANPLGVQMDLIFDDVNRTENPAWNAIWESVGKITDGGYVVEMAIPFSQLRFPRSDGEKIFGIDLLRMRPRNIRARLANNPQDRNRSCYVCQFSEFRGFANAVPSSALEIVPTLTSTRTDTRPPTAAGVFTNGHFDSQVGVSVRWGITPDVTGDLAIKPDFSQVEADVAQLEENTEFALFYPETRPFFLEGGDYYDSPLAAVFTRTVADPDLGAKITGRSGLNTFGSFLTRDVVTNLLLPGPLGSSTTSLDQSNDGFVGRYTRAFANASTIGALVTHRNGDNYHNDVAGFDGRYKINDQHTLRFQYLESQTEYPKSVVTDFDQPADVFNGDALRLEYRYGSRNWFANYFHQELDPRFRADFGFIPRVDLKEDALDAYHIWQGQGGTWWTSLRAGLSWDDARTEGGQLLARSFAPVFSFNGPLQSYAYIQAGPRQEFWNGEVFDMDRLSIWSQLRPASGLVIYFQGQLGEQIDYANSRIADQRRIQPQIEWNATRHLLVRLRYTLERLSSKSGPAIYRAELGDLRLSWQFNVRSFVRLTLQSQDTRRNVAQYSDPATEPTSSSLASQLLYSYKLNPQTVLFAGYSKNSLEDASTGTLEPTGRTMFFKISYAWTR